MSFGSASSAGLTGEAAEVLAALGVHAHWCGSQWQSGTLALPKLLREALRAARESRRHLCLDLDAAGVERLATDCPDSLELLRDALQKGEASITNGSYSQPIPLIHGGESVARQWAWGVRTLVRLTGVRPRFFWPSEGGIMPQLPQILTQCGFTCVCLEPGPGIHTPTPPFESRPVSAWSGPDGVPILLLSSACGGSHFEFPWWDAQRRPGAQGTGVKPDQAAENAVNSTGGGVPLAPHLAVEGISIDDLPERRHDPSWFWHGISLARGSHEWTRELVEEEARMLAWESTAAMLSLWGSLSPDLDPYPAWPWEEGWKALLCAQSHEAIIPGSRAKDWAEPFKAFAGSLCRDSYLESRLGERAAITEEERLYVNPRGWEKPLPPGAGVGIVPPFGWRAAPEAQVGSGVWSPVLGAWTCSASGVKAEVDFEEGTIWVANAECPEGFQMAIPTLQWFEGEDLVRESGDPEVNLSESADPEMDEDEGTLVARWPHHLMRFTLDPASQGLILGISAKPSGLDPGFFGAIKACWQIPDAVDQIRCDTPYAVHPASVGAPAIRRFPLGEPHASPIWTDVVENVFTSHSFLCLRKGRTSLLLSHAPQPQWLIEGREFRHVIGMRDSWDGPESVNIGWASYGLIPHRSWSDAECWQAASAMARATSSASETLWAVWKETLPGSELPPDKLLPREFSALQSLTPGVSVTAFYREPSDRHGAGLDGYAGRMIPMPFVVRLVEFDGRAGEAQILVAGTVVNAYKTNLLGEVQYELEARPVNPPLGHPCQIRSKATLISVPLRGAEIATLYLDILEGRKETSRSLSEGEMEA
jgi:hypothetical protein